MSWFGVARRGVVWQGGRPAGTEEEYGGAHSVGGPRGGSNMVQARCASCSASCVADHRGASCVRAAGAAGVCVLLVALLAACEAGAAAGPEDYEYSSLYDDDLYSSDEDASLAAEDDDQGQVPAGMKQATESDLGPRRGRHIQRMDIADKRTTSSPVPPIAFEPQVELIAHPGDSETDD